MRRGVRVGRRIERGAVAIEFAIVMIPFMLVLFGIMEVALIMYTESVMTGKSAALGRVIRTGQYTGTSATDARTSFCSGIFLLDCSSRLKVNVTTLQSGTLPPAIDSSDNFALGADTYDIGSANDIVVMRFFYEYEFIHPGVRAGMKNLANEKRLIESATAFRVE